MTWTSANGPKCPVSPADRGEFMKPKIQSSDGGVESRHATASGSGPLPEPIVHGDACSALEPPHQAADTVGRHQEPKRAAGVTTGPSEAISSVSTPAQDETALAERILFGKRMDGEAEGAKGEGDLYTISVPTLARALETALRATSQTPDALCSTLEDIIAVYEWCSVDPIDRGYSSLDSEIHRAKHLLSTPSASAGPPTNFPRFIGGASDNDNPRAARLIFARDLTAEDHVKIAEVMIYAACAGPQAEAETWVTKNPDGSISLDAYAGWSREQLKDRCSELCMAVEDWAFTAVSAATDGNNTIESVREPYRSKIAKRIEAYSDDEPHAHTQPQQADGRGAVIEVVARLREYAAPLDGDESADSSEPNLREDIETVCRAALQQSPATDNAPAVGAQERNSP